MRQMQREPSVYPAPPRLPAERKSPAPPPQRSSAAPRRSSFRKRRRRGRGLAAWQWVMLILLAVCLVSALVYWGQGQSRLTVLRAQREQERLAYEKQVKDHQVRYRELIEKYAAEYELNPAFVSAIIMNESSYNPKAVSNKGAMGLMQFMPETFEWVPKHCGYSNKDSSILFEPEPAIKMGCYYLRYIIDEKIHSDDPILVACSYHAGGGNVAVWLKNYSSDGVSLTFDQIPRKTPGITPER